MNETVPETTTTLDCDLAVVGAGAAGLMAAIFAGRAAGAASRPLRIVAVDGARTLGAKILVAGGGRCNVTHHAVDETAYAGSSRNAIRNVLRRFDVEETRIFFKELGVELKREDTGKLFPVTDDAHTILNALLRAARDAGVTIIHPWRVAAVERTHERFGLTPAPGTPAPHAIHARRIVLATGGKSLPKSGSDGVGYSFARALGHTTTRRIFPSLVPLLLPKGHPLTELSGLTFPASLELRSSAGKLLATFTNSTLLTHFGLSGPSVLDISRYYLDAQLATPADAPPPVLSLNVLPHHSPESLDEAILNAARSTPQLPASRLLIDHGKPPLPERLGRAICDAARLDPLVPLHALTKDQRRAVVLAATRLPLPITGDRGFTYAEVTAGGVPLSELQLKTMESRPCPGLHLCGEICDVDGRIGGFNFQWAWASGFVAGTAAAESLIASPALA